VHQALLLPPNGVPVSRRERAANHLQKTNDLVRDAVDCTGVLGGSTHRSPN
jgi:hypothetical protein